MHEINSQKHNEMALFLKWKFVSDHVMGGLSTGQIDETFIKGQEAIRLYGTVSLDNNGGFIQMAADFMRTFHSLNRYHWNGIAINVIGNEEEYDIRLRTTNLSSPWQSFRTNFIAKPQWRRIYIPFNTLKAHRTTHSFDFKKIHRIGILAVGREFAADIAVSSLSLYRCAA